MTEIQYSRDAGCDVGVCPRCGAGAMRAAYACQSCFEELRVRFASAGLWRSTCGDNVVAARDWFAEVGRSERAGVKYERVGPCTVCPCCEKLAGIGGYSYACGNCYDRYAGLPTGVTVAAGRTWFAARGRELREKEVEAAQRVCNDCGASPCDCGESIWTWRFTSPARPHGTWRQPRGRRVALQSYEGSPATGVVRGPVQRMPNGPLYGVRNVALGCWYADAVFAVYVSKQSGISSTVDWRGDKVDAELFEEKLLKAYPTAKVEVRRFGEVAKPIVAFDERLYGIWCDTRQQWMSRGYVDNAKNGAPSAMPDWDTAWTGGLKDAEIAAIACGMKALNMQFTMRQYTEQPALAKLPVTMVRGVDGKFIEPIESILCALDWCGRAVGQKRGFCTARCRDVHRKRNDIVIKHNVYVGGLEPKRHLLADQCDIESYKRYAAKRRDDAIEALRAEFHALRHELGDSSTPWPSTEARGNE